jgi:hypothetical protein
MGLDKIGTYKGYDVFKIGQRNIKENECLNDVMYVVAETGETILNGEVVAHVDLKEMRVDELPRSERRKYKFYPSTIEKPSVSRATGKRREVVSADDVLSSQIVDPTPMDEIIDKFLADARNATVETYIKIIEINGMA